MNTALAAAAAGPSPAITVPVVIALVIAGIVMCTYVGHRWSTLIVGVLIGLFLTGPVAETAKSVVAQIVIALTHIGR
ncbi:hypothetical protein ACFYNY_26750 [Streptomyces sp. NPDC006530]|uniref:hypothetical protein n=1 Tax=Streptomyces sp. NPDC006530 TaxID=3364750 RepID=UPI00369BBB38